MKDGDEFVKWSKQVWDYNLPLIESYKPLLVHKDRAILLDLSLKIQAYDFGIRMQARTDFSDDWFLRYAEEGYIEENDAKEVKTKVNQSFQSSFDNERSEKIKNLVLGAELIHAPSKVEPLPNQDGEPPLKNEVSLYDDFVQAYLPAFFRSRRQYAAKSLKRELQLSEDIVSQIQPLAFNEIISLVNRKSTLCHLDQNSSVNIGSVVGFLERSIAIHFAGFLRDLGLEHEIVSLLALRKNTKHPFNTLCWRCSRPLFKKDNKHYCTRRENRCCYEARLKEKKQSGFPVAILRTKNRCDNCGRYSSFNHIHKHKGQQMQFCSNRCWETYRKRKWRKKKKSIN